MGDVEEQAGRCWPEPATFLLALAFFILYFAVFGAAAAFGDHVAVGYRVGFAWESAIPLLPWTAAVYLSLDLMAIPLLLRFPTPRSLLPVLATLGAELSVATVLFVIFPVQNGFRDPAVGGISGALLDWARTVSLQHNYFPSLHVALAFTGAAVLGRGRSVGTRLFFYVWASLIAVATLTTHQHYFVDVVGGMALAALAFHRVYLPLSRR